MHHSHAVALATLMFLSSTGTAQAQAWVGPERSLSASLNYEFSRSTAIVEEPSIKVDDEPIVSHAVILGAEYVPIEKLGLTASLPFLATKYQGTGMLFPRHGSYDDGSYHMTPQDLLVAARYQVLAEPVALAPHLSFTIPVADYETLGYANAGRHLKQLHLGLSAGTIYENLYVHALYEFTLSEKYDATAETEEIGQNRSDLALNLGYLALAGDLDISLGANFRFAHGGIKFVDYNDLSPELQMYHDPLLREEFILVGPSASYQVTEKLRISALARLYVRGRNTRNANSVGIGIDWAFL